MNQIAFFRKNRTSEEQKALESLYPHRFNRTVLFLALSLLILPYYGLFDLFLREPNVLYIITLRVTYFIIVGGSVIWLLKNRGKKPFLEPIGLLGYFLLVLFIILVIPKVEHYSDYVDGFLAVFVGASVLLPYHPFLMMVPYPVIAIITLLNLDFLFSLFGQTAVIVSFWKVLSAWLIATGISVYLYNLVCENSIQKEKLEQRTEKLSGTLQELKETQDLLIESHKMAALGELVGGIAHELNTPLGNCLISANTTYDECEKIIKNYEQGAMTKSDLETHFDVTHQRIEAIRSNLERAAGLIKDFKMVAVDQSDDHEVKAFNVAQYIEKILNSIEPAIEELKEDKNLTVEIVIAPESDISLMLTSHPGAFSQIVTNLINNAHLHAFHPDSSDGKVTIRFAQEKDHLLLTVQDNGVGMSEDIRSRVFEPFFTTKRNNGGTGIGLHVTYTLVQQKLNGTIQCHSQEGQGTTFEVRLPV